MKPSPNAKRPASRWLGITLISFAIWYYLRRRKKSER
jgi:LPXTG-motif cell wall-anchored protein